MSPAPEQPEELKQQSPPREEAALPVAASPRASNPALDPDSQPADASAKRRTMLRVVGSTVVLSVVMSAFLEYGGWQRAFADMPTPHAPIPPLAFLRGVWDTTLGAVGIGAAGVVGALLFPSTWRKGWRRVPAAFALGATAFLAFLSFVTFDFMR